MDNWFTQQHMEAFRTRLRAEERSAATAEKYLRDIRAFGVFLSCTSLTKGTVMAWKENLLRRGYAPRTVNSMLVAVNRYLVFIGRDECRVRAVKVQRQLFREASRELTRAEYEQLVNSAESAGNKRLALLLETICATGIRVSEVKYITAEAARNGKSEIWLKGKVRVILLPKQLRRKLTQYAKHKKIASGEIFLTRSGNSLSRKQIWADMKALCRKAGVEASKVFPHNLRHLFARTFYKVCHDVAKLADVLGHSSIETTRIYLISTGTEHVRQLERLQLIS